jgi:hypothetical protein
MLGDIFLGAGTGGIRLSSLLDFSSFLFSLFELLLLFSRLCSGELSLRGSRGIFFGALRDRNWGQLRVLFPGLTVRNFWPPDVGFVWSLDKLMCGPVWLRVEPYPDEPPYWLSSLGGLLSPCVVVGPTTLLFYLSHASQTTNKIKLKKIKKMQIILK